MGNKVKTLYIDTSKSPKSSLVRSLASNNPARMDAAILGDIIPYHLIFVNGGEIDTDIAGNPNYTIKVEVGNLGGSALAYSDEWGISGSVFTGSVNYATNELTASLLNESFIDTFFEVTVRSTLTSNDKKYLQTGIQVWNEVNVTGTTPVSSSEYYNKVESDARYLTSGAGLSASFLQGGNNFGTTATAGTKDNQALHLLTNNTPRVYIGSAGNVGIGATFDSTNKFGVDGNIIVNTNITASGGIIANNISSSLANFVEVRATRITGSLFGTASWATNAGSASYLPINSYPITSSWATNAETASYLPINTYPITASWANSVAFLGKSNNYVPVWIGNVLSATSSIFNDGTNVIVGGTSGTERLHVVGGIRSTTNITGSNLLISNDASIKNISAISASITALGANLPISSNTHLAIGSSTLAKSSLRLTPGDTPSSPTTGDIWNGATGQINFRENGATVIIPGVISRQTATVSRTGATSTAQQLFSPVVSLPADFLKATQILKVRAWGFHNAPDATSNTHSLALNMAISGAVQGVVNLNSFSTTVSTNTTNGYWMYDGYATVRSVGAAGSVVSDAKLDIALGTTSTVYSNSSNGVVTVKTDEATALQLSVTLTDGDSSDNFVCQQAIVEIL